MIIIRTTAGDITVELDEKKAPATAENFLRYAREGFYDGTVFHRVIKNFMIQGGGLVSGLVPKRGGHPPIRNEADNGLSNVKYSIAMARTPDPHSATSQFFINTRDNKFLDHTAKTPAGWGYCVFGRVTAGFETVDRIENLKTGSRGRYDDVPETEVTITEVTVK